MKLKKSKIHVLDSCGLLLRPYTSLCVSPFGSCLLRRVPHIIKIQTPRAPAVLLATAVPPAELCQSGLGQAGQPSLLSLLAILGSVAWAASPVHEASERGQSGLFHPFVGADGRIRGLLEVSSGQMPPGQLHRITSLQSVSEQKLTFPKGSHRLSRSE